MTARRLPADAVLARGASRAVRSMALELGGLKCLAAAMGVSLTQAQRYADPNVPDSPSLAQVCAASAEGATSAAEFLADIAGGRFLPGAAEDAPSCVRRAMADASAEAAETSYVIGRVLADGVISAAEKKRLRRMVNDGKWALVNLDAALGKEP